MITASEFLKWCEVFHIPTGNNPPSTVTLQVAYDSSPTPKQIDISADNLNFLNGILGVGVVSYNTNSIFQVDSSTSGSLPYPRMNGADEADLESTLGLSDVGMSVYNTDLRTLDIFDGSQFQNVLTVNSVLAGANVTIDNNLDGTITVNSSGGGTTPTAAFGAWVITSNTVSVSAQTTPTPIVVTSAFQDITSSEFNNQTLMISGFPTAGSTYTGSPTQSFVVNATGSFLIGSVVSNNFYMIISILKANTTIINTQFKNALNLKALNDYYEISLSGIVQLSTGDTVFVQILADSPGNITPKYLTFSVNNLAGSIQNTDGLLQGSSNQYLSQDGGTTYENVTGLPVVVGNLPSFSTVGGKLQDSGISSSSVVLNNAGTYNINISGNAATATSAGSAADINTSVTSVNSNFFIPLLSNSSGVQPVQTCAPLIFNPNSGIMSLTGLKITGLTALQAVVSDGVGNLTSLAYTNANTVNTLVERDGSGNFSAGTITATLSGTATNATNVATNQVTTNASYFPLMVASSVNGNQAVDLSTGFTFNPSNNTMQMNGLNLTGVTASTLTAFDSGKNLVSLSAGTTTTVLHGNASGLPTYGAVALTTDVSGILPFANGGFGFATATTGDLFYASATNTPGKLSDVATGSVLVSGGVGVAPAWSTSPTLTGATFSSAPNVSFGTASANVLTLTSSSGAANRADLALNRNDSTNGNCRVLYQTATASSWSVGMRSGGSNYTIFDEANTLAQITVAAGPGVTGISTFAGSIIVNNTLNVSSTATLSASSNSALLFGTNGGGISAKNSSGGQEVFCFPRFTDNRTYMDIGSAGATFRQNAAGATWMSVDTSSNVTLSSGNLLIGNATKGIQLKSVAVSAGTANALMVTGCVLVGGTVTITDTSVTTNHRGIPMLQTSGGTLGAWSVTCGSGTFTINSTSATDTSTLSVLFVLPN